MQHSKLHYSKVLLNTEWSYFRILSTDSKVGVTLKIWYKVKESTSLASLRLLHLIFRNNPPFNLYNGYDLCCSCLFSLEENEDGIDYEMMKSGAVPVNHQYINVQRRGKHLAVIPPPPVTHAQCYFRQRVGWGGGCWGRVVGVTQFRCSRVAKKLSSKFKPRHIQILR